MKKFFIVGPTGIGKSSLAIKLAQKFNSCIINSDPFQLFNGLKILTASPSENDLKLAHHYLYNQLPIHKHINITIFNKLHDDLYQKLKNKYNSALIVGGSGLYIKTLTHGIDSSIPAHDPIRREQLNKMSLFELQNLLKKIDPNSLEKLDQKNPRRLIRAIEIFELTGTSFFKHYNTWNKNIKNGIYLTADNTFLNDNITNRTNKMFLDGAISEIKNLLKNNKISDTAQKTIGLQDIEHYINNNNQNVSLENLKQKIIKLTMKYAKRQKTWFKKQQNFHTITISNKKNSITFLNKTEKKIETYFKKITNLNTF